MQYAAAVICYNTSKTGVSENRETGCIFSF